MPIRSLRRQAVTHCLPLNATDNVSAASGEPAGHPGIPVRFLRKESS